MSIDNSLEKPNDTYCMLNRSTNQAKSIPMKTEHLKRFGAHIRYLRNQQQLSQEQLAEKAGMHRTYIGMVERGERNPALLNLIRLAEALEVSLTSVMDFNTDESD